MSKKTADTGFLYEIIEENRAKTRFCPVRNQCFLEDAVHLSQVRNRYAVCVLPRPSLPESLQLTYARVYKVSRAIQNAVAIGLAWAGFCMATLGAIQKFGIRRDSRILKDEKSAPVVTFRSARTRSHFADVGETGDVLDKYLGQ
ncbi:MAG: hypothetical protein M3P12_05905, partial [Gemmatimonadota bacterium]|nr:hypothetical protein [Gemmatimonadota bacterium]